MAHAMGISAMVRWLLGETKLVENLLEGIEVRLNEDYLKDKAKWNAMAKKVVYTGAIDAYFDYTLGNLEYRSVRFENEILDVPNFQGNAAVNYTDRETPRIFRLGQVVSISLELKPFVFNDPCPRSLTICIIYRRIPLKVRHIKNLIFKTYRTVFQISQRIVKIGIDGSGINNFFRHRIPFCLIFQIVLV